MRHVVIAALLVAPSPVLAQSMPGMPGMKMPPPAQPRPKPKAKPAPMRVPAKPRPATPAAPAAPHAGHIDGMAMPADPSPAPSPATQDTMPGMTMPPAASAPAAPQPMAGIAGHDGMPGMAMGPGAFATGSGTARLPGAEGMMHGQHLATGDWMVMLHGYAWGAYTDQSGPRGDRMAFVTSMGMMEASRDLGGTKLALRSMLSLDPLIGRRGYPSLFATGETDDGVTPLIDRQHPHDLFMELSARIDTSLGAGVGGFLYGGPVAEPALGPSAFMHRGSARYLPLAPITHHWFDSTHITFGVVTAGLYGDRWQVEASAFRGREPDERRWDIETPRLDSWSVRATWNPSPHWSAQVSHGRLREPEALEPGVDEARTTASVQFAGGGVTALAGFAVKDRLPGRRLTAWIGEANWDLGKRHSLFGRVENVANDELFPDPADPRHDRPYRITRTELGYAYRIPLGPVEAAIGGSGFATAKPAALDGAYGRAPAGWTAFVKLSLGG